MLVSFSKLILYFFGSQVLEGNYFLFLKNFEDELEMGQDGTDTTG
jgi:hypothetical protein